MKQFVAVLIMFGVVQLAVANSFEPRDEFSKPAAELIQGEPGRYLQVDKEELLRAAMADLIPKLKVEIAKVGDTLQEMQALEKQGEDDPSASIVGRKLWEEEWPLDWVDPNPVSDEEKALLKRAKAALKAALEGGEAGLKDLEAALEGGDFDKAPANSYFYESPTAPASGSASGCMAAASLPAAPAGI